MEVEDKINIKPPQTDFQESNNNDNILTKKELEENKTPNDKKQNSQLKILMPTLDGAYVKKEEFSNFQNKDIKEPIIEKYYKKYQEHYQQRYFEKYFEDHWKDIWFDDKYNPRSIHVIELSRKNAAKTYFLEFLEKFKNIKEFSMNFNDYKTILEKLQTQTKSQYINYFVKNINDLQNSYIQQFCDIKYIQVKKIPKNLSQLSINDTMIEIKGIKNFFIGEALRYKDYERYGFIQIDQNIDINEILENLKKIHFNYAQLEFEVKTLNDRKILVCQYSNKDQVFEDYNIAIQVLEKLINYNNIDKEKYDEILETENFLERFYKISLLLHKVFNFIVSKQKIYLQPMKLLFQGSQICLSKFNFEENQLTQQEYNNWENQRLSNMNDVKKLRLENFMEQIQEQELQLKKAEQAIEDKVFSRLKERLKEDSNFNWPCIKCDKAFETQDYLLNHFTQKHSKSVQKYQEKIFINEVFKTFMNDNNKHFYIEYKQTFLTYSPFNQNIVHEEIMKIRQREVKRKPQNTIFEYENLQLIYYNNVRQKLIQYL